VSHRLVGVLQGKQLERTGSQIAKIFTLVVASCTNFERISEYGGSIADVLYYSGPEVQGMRGGGKGEGGVCVRLEVYL